MLRVCGEISDSKRADLRLLAVDCALPEYNSDELEAGELLFTANG